MNVFISWSGPLSKAIAEILRQWLPGVIQAVKPYYTADDLAKGTRWQNEIAKELESARVGLICVTADNIEAPWIMFEAGALSKNIERSRVCPLLFGVDPSGISGPLVQFQASVFSKEEMERVMRMMNAELGDAALPPEVLSSVFEMWWPHLHARITSELKKGTPQIVAVVRSERDILEEILALVRSQGRARAGGISSAAIRDLSDAYTNLCTFANTSDDTTLRKAILRLERPMAHILRHAEDIPAERWATLRDLQSLMEDEGGIAAHLASQPESSRDA